MSIYVYKKDKPEYVNLKPSSGSIKKPGKDPIWQFLVKRKREQLILTGLLSIAGLVLLSSQLIPLIYTKIQAKVISEQAGEIQSPIPEAYAEEIEKRGYMDVNKSYFANLVSSIKSSKGTINNENTKPLKVDESYSKPMKITIESIGMKNLNISPNVDGLNDNVYNAALKHGAAHFKGTVLPGDNDYGNFVVYGHSALPSFFARNQNYDEIEFTKLHNIRIGDKIQITKDGKIYEYVAIKNQVVKPEDFDVINGIEGESTITLISCFPAGDPSGRWVTLGREIK